MFFFLFELLLLSDEPEVFLPNYSQIAIYGAHFQRVVNYYLCTMIKGSMLNSNFPFLSRYHVQSKVYNVKMITQYFQLSTVI